MNRSELLLDYALGTLSRREREAVERRLGEEPELCAELQRLETSLELLALSAAELEPSEDLRTRILGAADPNEALVSLVPRLSSFFDLTRGETEVLLNDADSLGRRRGWEPALPGVELFHLEGGPRVAGSDCGLVHIEPGVAFPSHEHGGDEWALVLSGYAMEDEGADWAPGDLVHRPAGSRHSFRVDAERPFLFAVVLAGPLLFRV